MLVGCDTGGTFTDFVAFDPNHPEEGLKTLKLASTPEDPGRAVLEGLAHLCGDTPPVQVNHGTTVATNALLERSGGQVWFLTTRGFGDLLRLGRGARRELYALDPSRVEPPVTRERCLEVDERGRADGTVERKLSPEATEKLVKRLQKEAGVAAVCLLHSSINPEHERVLGKALEESGVKAFLSHRLAPGSGEYERGVTTLLAAYLSPKVESYIQRLSDELASSRLRIVHSAGGLLTPGESVDNPHRLALSGPAAGLRGALSVGEVCGELNLVTLDMGGTSTDVALLVNGELPYSWQTEIEGFPLRAPTLQIHTIGAGGGSIAWADPSGLLRVGPRSSGAVPGPACYGLGGNKATVTDALCLHRYLPTHLGHKELPLDQEKSAQVVSALGRELGLGRDETAAGILQLTASHLAGAVRKVTTELGHDPAAFTLFPFGGAGPLMACLVAEQLSIEKILVPACAGVLSAWGALTAPWEREWSRAVPIQSRERREAWEELLQELRGEAEKEFSGSDTLTWEPLVARRYEGQGETLVSSLDTDFHQLHQDRFGFSRPDFPIHCLEVRVRARQAPLSTENSSSMDIAGEANSHRTIKWNGEEVEVPVHLNPGRFPQPLNGPALIFQESATVLVAPGWEGRSLADGHLLLKKVSTT